MKNAKLQSILTQIADQAAPAAEIDLWKKLRPQLETSESGFSKGETLMKPNIARRSGVRRAALAAFVGVAIFTLLLATPPGQAFAQSILHFFTRVTVPQIASTLQSATPVNSNPEFFATCGGYDNPNCTVAQVRGMVGFEVKGLSDLPDGMRFAGATGGSQLVMLFYRNGTSGALLVDERPWTKAEDQLWQVSVSAVVESVTITPLEGSNQNTTGEYAVGGWSGTAFRQWNPSPDLQTLRWRQGDTVYSITSVGWNQYKGRSLDKAGMVQLAAAMTTDPAVLASTPASAEQNYPTPFSIPTVASYSGWLQTVQEAEALAGFDVVEPSWLPKGYAFNHASYLPAEGNVCLFYAHSLDAGSLPSLVIIENANGALPDIPEWTRASYEYLHYKVDPSLYDTPTTAVPVAGALDGQATVSRIGQVAVLECGESQRRFGQTMLWKTKEGRSFIIMTNGGPFNPFLTTLEARRLAENLNGVPSDIPSDAVDPERLPSAQAAESLWGSDILMPAQLPKGFTFDLAQYKDENGIRTVNLVYSSIYIQAISITIRAGATETLDDIFNRRPVETQRLTVRNQPAVYLQGSLSVDSGEWCWACPGEQILTWFENGMEYQVISLFPISTTKETLLALAEGMR